MMTYDDEEDQEAFSDSEEEQLQAHHALKQRGQIGNHLEGMYQGFLGPDGQPLSPE